MKIKRLFGTVEFHFEEDEYIIDMIHSIEKRKGAGSKLLSLVEKYVQNRKIKRISLFACPQDESISEENLFNFYRKNGYEDSEYVGMFYKEI